MMLALLLASTVLLVIQQQGIALAPLPGVKEYEVVYPQKLYSRNKRDTQTKYPDDVHYGLKVQGEDVVLHLKRNEDLLAPDYTETHYLPNGQAVTIRPPIADHCYYHGYLRNESDSDASISLCNGVRGYFRKQEQRYLIEPLKLTEGEEHAVYKYENLVGTPKTCGVTNTTWEEGPPIKRSRSGTAGKDLLQAKKYVELYMVADTSIFKKYNGSEAEVRERLYQIINYVNLVYKQINTLVALIGIEIWSSKDLIEVNASAGVNLDRFSAWRMADLLKRKAHDNAQFLTNTDFEGPTVGLAFVGTMCSNEHSTGVIQDHSRVSISVGATVAHEMGHNLGMNHDSSSCSCPESSCIMAPSLSYVTPTKFSTCSHTNFQDFILSRVPECMKNMPRAIDVMTPAVCGNGFIEADEQCDCGTPEECTNTCCDAAVCRLKPEAKCADGECCENCQIKTAGIVCRPRKDDCDLPDYCDGKSAKCPSDRFRVNGYPCKNGQGYCLMGTCPLHLSQCTDLWGASALRAAATCFEQNRRGLYYAFCKYSEGSFVPCASKDVLCGKLFCSGGADSPSIYANTVKFSECKGLIPASGYVENFAMVQNGTKCGDGLVCNMGKCVDLESAYRSTNCSNKCKGHGVCDHEMQCQCEEGWDPPNCDNSSGKNIVIIIVVVLIIVITLVVVLVLLWYRGTFKSKHQSSQPNTVSGLNNPGFEQKRNQPVIVHTPEMSNPDGRNQPTRVGYSSPQYTVASPSPDMNRPPPYANSKPMKPSTAPPPVPISKPAVHQSTFGPQMNIPPTVPSGKPAPRTAPQPPMGKPVLPPAPPQALKPPSSRPKI